MQATRPSFTASTILGVQDPDAGKIVVELGYANIAMGLIGALSLLISAWIPPDRSGRGALPWHGRAQTHHKCRAEHQRECRHGNRSRCFRDGGDLSGFVDDDLMVCAIEVGAMTFGHASSEPQKLLQYIT